MSEQRIRVTDPNHHLYGKEGSVIYVVQDVTTLTITAQIEGYLETFTNSGFEWITTPATSADHAATGERTMSEFKVGDRVRERGYERAGTVTEIRTDGAVAVIFDIERPEWLFEANEIVAVPPDDEAYNPPTDPRDAELARLRERVRTLEAAATALGLDKFLFNEVEQQSRRVFVYGALAPYGQYGWIIREDHSKPNPYFIVTDGVKAGLWHKAEHFKRVAAEDTGSEGAGGT